MPHGFVAGAEAGEELREVVVGVGEGGFEREGAA